MRLRGLSAKLIANRSDRRLSNLQGSKAREADILMSGRRADFHHGPELFVFYSLGIGATNSTRSRHQRGGKWHHKKERPEEVQRWTAKRRAAL
jgi:hypothetical protein